jgi:hypothetical protein
MGESPEIHPHEFSDPLLNGLYSELVGGGVPGLALDRGLSHEEQDALVAEARCYGAKSPRGGRKFCYAPISYEDMDRERIRALRRCIERERPDWVEWVRMATLVDNDVYTIVHFSGVPPYPAVAILENLLERGELGPPE